jgi:hypothetical protein
MKPEDIKVKISEPGWWAIADKRGGWVGNDKGVLCYEDEEIARAALTIVWQMEGGGALNFELKRFTEANTKTGDYDFKKSAVEALSDYENPRRVS